MRTRRGGARSSSAIGQHQGDGGERLDRVVGVQQQEHRSEDETAAGTDPLDSDSDDDGLTDGEEYCYKVTATDGSCESGYSNILCAVPTNVGQSVEAGVSGTDMQVGYLTGKGKTKSFVAASVIPLGEAVIVRTRVSDGSDPIADALVEIAISGQEQVTLSSGPSGTDGWAETTWQTQAPNRKGAGGTTPGAYTATVSNVTASGYVWDGVATARSFALE